MQFTDQLGRSVFLKKFPGRIISCVPSQTELLCDLGLEDRLAGITKFCVHPAGLLKKKPVIGGTKNLRMDKIISLQPDLIIANKEENIKEQIEQLAGQFPVWISDVNTLSDALMMIESIGAITNTTATAQSILSVIAAEKQQFTERVPHKKRRVLYLIWKDPYMAAGGNTYIHEMLYQSGFENAAGALMRYPTLSVDAMRKLEPDTILLSSEPYPFRETHKEEMQALFPGVKIVLADGQMFSWYGSRLQYCWKYFTSLRECD